MDNEIKIAIHHRDNSFSERWISYCKEKNIPYVVVNAYATDIFDNLKECTALLWHHHHGNYKDVITAKRIISAAENAGIKVFPSTNTGWHFDDKVAQKYLLEAIGAPLVPSFIFYDSKSANTWIAKNQFPKVFKLKGGAGSSNVSLVKSKEDAYKLVRTAFGKGFTQYDRIQSFKDRIKKYKIGKDTLLGVLKGFVRIFLLADFAKLQGREKGYIYFQEFIPNNKFDIRVIVIGNKSFAIKRIVREDDFRASGSGSITYSEKEIDIRCVDIAFHVSKQLKTQCLAYDFIFDENDEPLIVEISYGFSYKSYDKCPGYWTSDLKWNIGKIDPCGWIIEDMLAKIVTSKVSYGK